jgi:CO/xanthine dehydrogenase Mo-binding subunit
MPMLIAEELDCDRKQIRAEHAPADLVYAHPGFGAQCTGGSMSIASGYRQMRAIGATARQMLIAAAAERWGLAPERIATRRGTVVERGGKRAAAYGQLADAAMRLPVPGEVRLKEDPKSFTLIGHPTRRIDSAAKVDGSARFGMDQSLPGMRVATIARPPAFGGKAVKVDDTRARAIKGVQAVLQVPVDRGGTGVAVIADGYRPAHQGRDALDIQWDLPAGPGSAGQIEQCRIRVHKVCPAIDCGTAVNPLTIEAQVNSAVVFGLSAALYGRITLKDGRVEQSNFPDYPVLRFDEMPQTSVHLVPSRGDPSGVGEPGTAAIAPAVANALAKLTGKRLRRLPLELGAA